MDEIEFVFYLLFIELYLFVTSVGLVVTSAAGNLRFPCGGSAESHPLGLCRFSRISVAYGFVPWRFSGTFFSVDVSPIRGYGLLHGDSTHSDIDQRDSPAVVLTAPKITLEEGEDSLHQEVVEASACDGHHG